MFGIGPTELLVIGVVGLLLFGNRLPQVMRGMGQGFYEFRQAARGVQDEMNEVTR